MDIFEFADFRFKDFSTMETKDLLTLAEKGEEILANMKQIEPSIIDVIDKVNAELDKRK